MADERKLRDAEKLRAIAEKQVERDQWRRKIVNEKSQGRDWHAEHVIVPKGKRP